MLIKKYKLKNFIQKTYNSIFKFLINNNIFKKEKTKNYKLK